MALMTLALVAIVAFAFIRAVPGDPIEVQFGTDMDIEQAEALRHRLALDQPLHVQFWRWIRAALRGDLGESLRTHEPVLPLIIDRFAVSAVVILSSVALATLAAVPAGMVAAWYQDSKLDLAIVVSATLALSLPSFWLGLLLLLAFGVSLGWLPVVGYVAFSEDPAGALAYLIMPVATLSLIEMGVLTRMVRANTIEVLRMDFVTHARAKGLSDRTVMRRHVFPNAFAPTLTLIGLIIGQLLGGIAVVEAVFTIPGLGSLLVESIFERDYTVIQGCLLSVAIAFVFINLFIDLVYPLLDPRVAAE